MTEHSAQYRAQHAQAIHGLRNLTDWLDSDYMIPVFTHLPIVIPADSPAALADLAIGHGMDGPFTADDGSVFLHRSFGTVSWEAVWWADNAGASPAEKQARAWAAHHGCVIVPLADLVLLTDATREM